MNALALSRLVLCAGLLAAGDAAADTVITACASDTQTGAGPNLAQALAAGGVVRFNCPAGTSIAVSGRFTVAADTVIDGGDAITLDGQGRTGPFLRSTTAKMTLRRLVLRGFVSPPRAAIGLPDAAVLQASGAAELDHVTIDACQNPIDVHGAATVTDSIFTSNRGIAFVAGGLLRLVRSTFTENEQALLMNAGSIEHSSFIGQTNGAVRIASPSGPVEVLHTAFRETSGGAALVLSQQSGGTGAQTIVVRANTFQSNEVGAIHLLDLVQEARDVFHLPPESVERLSHLPPSRFVLSYNRFERNSAVRGGAIDADLAHTSGMASTADLFIDNAASADGGAVAVSGGPMQVTHAVFRGNQAQGRGAALSTAAQAQLVVANTLVVKSAGPAGALSGDGMTLVNVTVADNGSAGVRGEGGSVRIRNSILAHNRGGDCAQVPAGAFDGKNAVSDGTCPGVAASDASLDTLYVPAASSAAAQGGDAAVCRATPVGGVDLAFQGRTNPAACALGALEQAPVRKLARSADRNEGHADTGDDFSDTDGYRPPPDRVTRPHEPTPSDTLLALKHVGIDFSVEEKDLREWLANAEFTPYPAIVRVLLDLLKGQQLKGPVFLDVIVWNYEHTPGMPSPRQARNVSRGVLKAAMVEGFNERNGTAETGFDNIVRRR